MNTPLYRVQGIRKAYGGRFALQVAELDIFEGEILALVGPSGAGKSTLLRLLNFLEPPDEGEILFHGRAFTPTQPMPIEIRRRVTTVFQQPSLLSRTVEANVSYGLRLRGRRNEEERVEAALAQVGLDHLIGQHARTLSGGEAQRVALARAIVLKPDVLLLDEPTANLDPYNVGMIEKIVRTVNEEEGATLVLVTHNIFQARRLAHRVAFLLDGRLIELTDADTFFNHPADPRTAAFVRGDMVY